VEVLAGNRPTSQLLSWTTDRVYRQVSARVAAAPELAGHARVRVCSVRVTTPSAAVAEVTVVTDDGVRSRAVALRLEAIRGRWLCTAVEPAW
jgi:hypothetical protein